MTYPIRVLHVLGKLNMGGAESRIMDLYRHIDRTRVQFDFLVHYRADSGKTASDSSEALAAQRPEEYFDEEIRSLGGRIYVLPRFTGTNLFEYRRAVRNFFADHHEFAAVEGHMTSTAAIYLPIAKAAGVPVTIAHARSAGIDPGIHGLATKLLRHDLSRRCDLCFSCSAAASVAVFGEKAVREGRVQIVPNALDVRSFQFDPRIRDQVRRQYGIPGNAFVLGHVGRFDPVKNQKFLVDVLSGIPGGYCMFVGEGSLEPEVAAAFAGKGLGERAIFAGQCDRKKTTALYQAFDAFCFPSLYEGLPGTVIEAQAAGLPCLISDTITKEVCVTDLVRELPIQTQEPWIRELRSLIASKGEAAGRAEQSAAAIGALDAAGYDIVTAARKMQEFYLHCGQ